MVRKRAMRIIAGLAMGGALALVAPAPAYATAVGTTPVRTFEYSVGGMTVKVPTGYVFARGWAARSWNMPGSGGRH